MFGIRLLLIIVRREKARDYKAFLKRENMTHVFSALCEGTASRRVLGVLGLEDTQQALLCTMTDQKSAHRLINRMVADMGILMPGAGIAVTLPVGSLGGASSANMLLGKPQSEGEETGMDAKTVYPYDLIVVVAKRGYADRVMNAARGAGAGGGTIVHAQGSANEATARFFGVSIADEKDMVLIVARHGEKDAIMRAVMEQAGIRTEAGAVLFSMPVESAAGLYGAQ